MSEIEDLLHTLSEEYEEEREESQKSFVEEDPKKVSFENVKKELLSIEEYIEKRCNLKETSIKIIDNGFAITKTFSFKDDFGTIYDKNHKVINIDDTVRLKVYYGEVEGKVVDLDRSESIVYVDVNRDIFFKPSSECELVGE